jgi:hypothetical protein
MAIVTHNADSDLRNHLDMADYGFFFTLEDIALSSSPTEIVVTLPDQTTHTYHGSFQYETDPATGEPLLVGGTLTGFTSSPPQLQPPGSYTISGLNIPVEIWGAFVVTGLPHLWKEYAFAGADQIFGGPGFDKLLGYDGADTFTGGTGNDSIDGGSGLDTAVFSGNRSNYHIVEQDGQLLVGDKRNSADGTDFLIDVETLKFADATVTVNIVPEVAVQNRIVRAGRTFAASTLLATTDADGDSIAWYRFSDREPRWRALHGRRHQAERQHRHQCPRPEYRSGQLPARDGAGHAVGARVRRICVERLETLHRHRAAEPRARRDRRPRDGRYEHSALRPHAVRRPHRPGPRHDHQISVLGLG